jgi:hypothetical protein
MVCGSETEETMIVKEGRNDGSLTEVIFGHLICSVCSSCIKTIDVLVV